MKGAGQHSLPALFWFLLFAGSAQALAFAPLYPALCAETGARAEHLSLLAGGYTLVFALTTLGLSPYLARLPRRRLLALATLLVAGGLVALPAVKSLTGLLLLRLLTAAGHALLTPTIVLAFSGFGARTQLRLTGWVLSGHAIAHLVGVPALVWFTGNGFSPRTLLAAIGLLLLFPALFLARPGVPSPTGDPLPAPLRGLQWKPLWTNQATRFVLIGAFLSTASTSAFVLYFPLLLTEHFPHAAVQLPLWLLASGLAQTAALPLGGRTAAQRGLRYVLLLSTVGSLVVGVVLGASGTELLAIGGAFVLLSGLSGLRAAPLQAGVTMISGESSKPAATALLNALHQLGRTTGSAIGLLALAPGGLKNLAWVSTLGWLLAAALFAVSPALDGISATRKRKRGPALARGLQDEDVQKTPRKLATKAD